MRHLSRCANRHDSPRAGFARDNVRQTIRTWLFLAHGVAWLIYLPFFVREVQPDVGLTLTWSTRGMVACWLMGVYAVLVTASYLRFDHDVRASEKPAFLAPCSSSDFGRQRRKPS